MALLFLKGVSGQQAHTPNSAGPVEGPHATRTVPGPPRAPRRGSRLCAHLGAPSVWGESLISSAPHYFQREKTQFLWKADNLKMDKLVQKFLPLKKKKKGRREGRMKGKEGGRAAEREGAIPKETCEPVPLIRALSSSVGGQTGGFSQPDASSCGRPAGGPKRLAALRGAAGAAY